MALTRKRRKELKRLKGQAEDLWNDQKELLDHASAVVREASQQAANYAREEVSPKIHSTIDTRVKPVVSSSVAGARSAAESTRNKVKGDILPAVTSALGTALAAIEVAKNQQVRDAFARVSDLATTAGEKTGLVKPQPKSAGFGRYILIGVGVVAAVGVAYAAWQTLRADDDLWIDDEAETA
ncbi:MAG: hypothetical protein V7618_03690 [Rhodoglobus sp.]|uniref:hypothetical protein n=1 Tax=uncultured Salinibacterium sp. TaxID=459274 RepID=UPI0030DC814F